MKVSIVLLVKSLLLVFMSAQVMAASQSSISIGYEQSSGNYGSTEETKSTSIPLRIKYTDNAWGFKLSIPYLSVTGDGSVIPSGSGSRKASFTGGPLSGVSTQSGLGDVVGSVTYSISPKKSYMYYELATEVKFGTASVKDKLGTGEHDVSLSLYSEYEKRAVKPFWVLGYTVIGDTKTTDFNDVFFITAGINYQMNAKTLMSLSYDYQQATIDGEENAEVMGLSFSRKINKKWLTNFYLTKGLSDSVADTGLGVGLVRKF